MIVHLKERRNSRWMRQNRNPIEGVYSERRIRIRERKERSAHEPLLIFEVIELGKAASLLKSFLNFFSYFFFYFKLTKTKRKQDLFFFSYFFFHSFKGWLPSVLASRASFSFVFYSLKFVMRRKFLWAKTQLKTQENPFRLYSLLLSCFHSLSDSTVKQLASPLPRYALNFIYRSPTFGPSDSEKELLLSIPAARHCFSKPH